MLYKVLDLFAGAGGMSLGFEQTQEYKIELAVENNKSAQETYLYNNPDVSIESDILSIDNFKELLERYGQFDVIIGGPPCQGFSNANRQRNSLINHNNSLVKKYIEVIENIKPKVFVMENVKMISSKTHVFFKTRHDNNDKIFSSEKVTEKEIIIFKGNAIFGDVKKTFNTFHDFSIYSIDSMLFSHLLNLFKYSLTPNVNPGRLSNSKLKCVKYLDKHKSLEDNSEIGEFIKQAIKKIAVYCKDGIEFVDVIEDYKKLIALQKLIISIEELQNNRIVINNIIENNEGISVFVDSIQIIDYIKEKFEHFYKIEDQILNALWFGAPQSRERYIAVGVRRNIITRNNSNLLPEKIIDNNFNTVKDAIYDLENVKPYYEVNSPSIKVGNFNNKEFPLIIELRNSNEIHNHVITNTRTNALERFASLKPGQNFHNLNKSMINNTYSKPERTQNSIYSRLDYCKPSGTVTNVRKSMWIHPEINRAVSIREAARLQTFPDNYIFKGTKDEQYQQVGNAVPPFMARAIAQNLLRVLKESK